MFSFGIFVVSFFLCNGFLLVVIPTSIEEYPLSPLNYNDLTIKLHYPF